MPINEVQVGRYNAILHKLLDMSEGAPSPSLATDIFPMIALEVDRPEWAFLGGERLCSMTWFDGATASNYSALGLRNPAGSGVLVVLEAVNTEELSVGLYFGLRSNSTIDASFPGRCRDSRMAAQNSVAEVVQVTQVAQPAYPYGWAKQFDVKDQPWIISPGYELMIWPAGLDVGIRLGLSWRERPLLPSETR